jgi:flagellar biosynthesis protein FlhF
MSSSNDEKIVTVEEVKSLREEISLMYDSLAHNVMVHAPLVEKVANIFIDKGVDRHWVEKLLAPLVGSSLEDDEVMLIAYVLEALDMLLDIEEEDLSCNKRVKLVVGATGIGKTSLIGKLAGRYKYLIQKEFTIAFINYDEHKVGAVEQLRHYADAMEIPLIKLEDLLDKSYDIVFIDTAGNMGEESQKLQSIIEILESRMGYDVQISLVLSATSKKIDLEKIFKSFIGLKIQNFIFTKIDETSDLSDMINFLIKKKIPLSYLSIGQEIPEDLIVASKEYILNKFMQK